jgi:hypothetical protein
MSNSTLRPADVRAEHQFAEEAEHRPFFRHVVEGVG